jgi:hypothetical protein
MLSFEDSWKGFTDKVGELPGLGTYSNVLHKCRNTLWDIIINKVILEDSLISFFITSIIFRNQRHWTICGNFGCKVELKSKKN